MWTEKQQKKEKSTGIPAAAKEGPIVAEPSHIYVCIDTYRHMRVN